MRITTSLAGAAFGVALAASCSGAQTRPPAPTRPAPLPADVSPPGADALAPLLEGLGLGDYRRSIAGCGTEAVAYFDQGLRLGYAYYAAEAAASFREAIRLDDGCAMAYWGLALALGPNPTSRYLGMPDDPAGAAAAAARAAAARGGASDADQALIDAMAERYADGRSRPAADSAYVEGLRRARVASPDDPDAAALLAQALMMRSPWTYWTATGEPATGTQEAREALEAAIASAPEHPGAHHFVVRLLERSPEPESALPKADALRGLAPGAGHLVHVASHIYLRTGRYVRAMQLNRASIAADAMLAEAWGESAPPTDGVTYGLSPLAHTAHANDILYLAALRLGMAPPALRFARDATGVLTPERLRDGVTQARAVRGWLALRRFGRWEDILGTLPPPDLPPYVQGVWHMTRGSALAALGDVDGARVTLDSLRAAAAGAAGSDRAMVNPVTDLLEIAGLVLDGDIAAALGQWDAAAAAYGRATELEDALGHMEPSDWPTPVRVDLGRALRQAGRAEEAERVYREALRRDAENGWALFGLQRSLQAQGRDAEARAVEVRFQAAWRGRSSPESDDG
ncbi:MAG: hypothetical protein ABFS34_02850 [Gemmatimonadota bacterium]